jgi:hypothetical protein
MTFFFQVIPSSLLSYVYLELLFASDDGRPLLPIPLCFFFQRGKDHSTVGVAKQNGSILHAPDLGCGIT